MVWLQLLWYTQFTCDAMNDVASFGFHVAEDDGINAQVLSDDVTIRLWFNHSIYSCKVSPSSSDTIYSCSGSSSIISSSKCNPSDDEVMIDNDATFLVTLNTVVITNVLVTTPGGTPYEIESLFNSDGSSNGPDFSEHLISDVECGSGYKHYRNICCDKDADVCGPQRQSLWFDITRLDEYETIGTWTDGMSTS